MVHAMENECKEAENDLRQEFEASREEIKVVNVLHFNWLLKDPYYNQNLK